MERQGTCDHLALHAVLRADLAPIQGYLQLIARRPSALRGATPADVIATVVLPALERLTDDVDRLLQPPPESVPETQREPADARLPTRDP